MGDPPSVKGPPPGSPPLPPLQGHGSSGPQPVAGKPQEQKQLAPTPGISGVGLGPSKTPEQLLLQHAKGQAQQPSVLCRPSGTAFSGKLPTLDALNGKKETPHLPDDFKKLPPDLQDEVSSLIRWQAQQQQQHPISEKTAKYLEQLKALGNSEGFKKLTPELQKAIFDYLRLNDSALSAKGFAQLKKGDLTALGSIYNHWLSHNDHANAQQIVDALKGGTELGPILKSAPESERARFMAYALPHMEHSEVARLVQLVKNDDSLRGVVALALMNYSAELMWQGTQLTENDPSDPLRFYANQALVAMRGHDQELGQLISHMPHLPRVQNAALFVRILTQGSWYGRSAAYYQILSALNSLSPPLTDSAHAAILAVYVNTLPEEALYDPYVPREVVQDKGPRQRLIDKLARAIVRAMPATANSEELKDREERLKNLMKDREGAYLLFGGSEDRKHVFLRAVIRNPYITPFIVSQETRRSSDNPAQTPIIAATVAEILVPADEANREAAVKNLYNILKTRQGQRLLFNEPPADEVPFAARERARQLIVAGRITPEMLQKTWDPWKNENVLKLYGETLLANYKSDDPVMYSGKNLENMVGAAMNLWPTVPPELREKKEVKSGQAALDGSVSFYPQKEVTKVAEMIRNVGGSDPKVTVVPIICSHDRIGDIPAGPTVWPLFRVQTSDGRECYVDNTGRYYSSFKDWKDENRLPKGIMLYPADGHLKRETENLVLTSSATPASSHLGRQVVDNAALVGGVVAGGLVILGTGGWGAAVVGFGVSGWGGYRKTAGLLDLRAHGQSLSLSNEEACDLWFGLAGDLTGAGAFIAEIAVLKSVAGGGKVSKLVAEGKLVKGLHAVTSTVGRTAAVTNLVVLLYDAGNLVKHWDEMDPSDRITALLNLAFAATVMGVGHYRAKANPLELANKFIEIARGARFKTLNEQANKLVAQLDQARGQEKRNEILRALDKVEDDIVKLITDPAKPSDPEKSTDPNQIPYGVNVDGNTNVDINSFWPNPAAPNGPNLIPHDQVVNAVGRTGRQILQAMGRTPFYNNNTYRELYNRASPETRASLPAPGTIRVDDHVINARRMPGGLQDSAADIHAHPYPYDGRSPWNDRLLLLRPGTDNLITTLRMAGAGARIAMMPIPQGCGADTGYYASPNPVPLNMNNAMARDQRTGNISTALSQRDAALAAHGDIALTGLDFSKNGTQDPLAYTQQLWRDFPGIFKLVGEITADKELVGQQLADAKWNLSDLKFNRWLRGLPKGTAIVLHSDWGHAGISNPSGRPSPVKTAYENLREIIELVRRHPNIQFILAHTGIGRYVRPNDGLVDVFIPDPTTGKPVLRKLPEHIANIYALAKYDNVVFDMSWNDVAQAYEESPILRQTLVDFIVNNPDRILFGSDTVKPVNFGHYNQSLATAFPILAAVARRDPEALWKLLRGNYERVVTRSAQAIVDWTRANHNDPAAIQGMNARLTDLEKRQNDLLKIAREKFDKWLVLFKAQDRGPVSDNPGVFSALFDALPDAHEHHGPDSLFHPGEGVNPAWGPTGRGTSGGYAGELPGKHSHPNVNRATQVNRLAIGGLGLASLGSTVGLAYAGVGNMADAGAFMVRGGMFLARSLFIERMRLNWEKTFEEGHATKEDVYRFMGKILREADAFQLNNDQRAQLAAVTEQFFANYQYLAEQPLDPSAGWDETQRFVVIMQEVGRYQITVDRILGTQASGIHPFDSRTDIGMWFRAVNLFTYLVNDATSIGSIQEIFHNPANLLTPAGFVHGSFVSLFAIGNFLKTGELIAALGGRFSGRLNESHSAMQRITMISNWALTAGGVNWTIEGVLKVFDDFQRGATGQAGIDIIRTTLSAAYTYGQYRVSEFQTAKVMGDPTPHGRNNQWAFMLLCGALILAEIVRMEEEIRKNAAAAQPRAVSPSGADAPAKPEAAPQSTAPTKAATTALTAIPRTEAEAMAQWQELFKVMMADHTKSADGGFATSEKAFPAMIVPGQESSGIFLIRELYNALLAPPGEAAATQQPGPPSKPATPAPTGQAPAPKPSPGVTVH